MNRLTSFIDAGNVYGDSLLSHALLNAPHGNLKKNLCNLIRIFLNKRLIYSFEVLK